MITTFLNVLIICASMFKHVCVHDMVSVQCQSVQWQSITLSGLNNNINETLNFGLIIAIDLEDCNG